MGTMGSDIPDDHGQDMDWHEVHPISRGPSAVSGFDRNQDAMRDYLFPVEAPKASPPVEKSIEPLVRVVIRCLLPKLPRSDRQMVYRYYRQCRKHYTLSRVSARRAVSVQIVVASSNQLNSYLYR